MWELCSAQTTPDAGRRTPDDGRRTMDAGPSTPYYKLTGELKMNSKGSGLSVKKQCLGQEMISFYVSYIYHPKT